MQDLCEEPTLQAQPFQRGDCLYRSEFDVCSHKILADKDGPCTEIIEKAYNGRSLDT